MSENKLFQFLKFKRCWMNQNEIKQIFEVGETNALNGMIIGKLSDGETVALPNDGKFNGHALVVGASGTMKTFGVIYTGVLQAIKNEESIVVCDNRGACLETFDSLLKSRGYEIEILDLNEPALSAGWDLLAGVREHSEEAGLITNTILGNAKIDLAFDDATKQLMKALILYAAEQKDGTFKDVIKMSKSSVSALKNIFERLSKESPAHMAFLLASQASSPETCLDKVRTAFESLDDPEYLNILNGGDFDFAKPCRSKCAYFINVNTYETSVASDVITGLFLAKFLYEIYRYIDKNRSDCIPVNILLDNINSLGLVGGDASYLAKTLPTAECNKIFFTIAVSSIRDLRDRFSSIYAKSIAGCCDLCMMLGCTDDETAEAAADRCELTTEQVLKIPQDELLVFARGNKPIRLKKFYFKEHPVFAGV